ncbi:hypothetical protein [Methylomicrobium lacus]|uniref:hypothetical protein n=1 Tax=Methylomicrobium lacus TaxID=136992 RepID=UPI0035A92EF9
MQIRRLLRVFVAAFTVAGVAFSISGCSVALPPFKITPDLYSSVVNSSNITNKTYLVLVRPAGAFIQVPYQLYDGEEMISAGQGSNLCHIYETSAGKHTLGLSFIAGTGSVGSIPKLRFRFIETELAPNKVYYLSINIGDTYFGGFVGGLQPISARLKNQENLQKWLSTCQLVKFDVATAKRDWVERYSTDFKPMFDESFREWKIQPNKSELLPEDGFNGFLGAAASP